MFLPYMIAVIDQPEDWSPYIWNNNPEWSVKYLRQPPWLTRKALGNIPREYGELLPIVCVLKNDIDRGIKTILSL